MAGPTGFEPAISSVTGRRDGPTSLRTLILVMLAKNYDSIVPKQLQPFRQKCIMIKSYAVVAQLVEQRTRKA